MSNLNLFEVLIVVTAFILISSTAFALVAPSMGFGLDVVKQQPKFPVMPDLNASGNQTALVGGGWAFSETQDIVGGAGHAVAFNSFNPKKQLQTAEIIPTLGFLGSYQEGYRFQRWGTWFIMPTWYNEPICLLNGSYPTEAGDDHYDISAQTILDNYNGTYSTFIIDNGNAQYMAYASFSPLPGYSDIASSFNSGHGFTVWVYGNAYAKPSWTDQVVNFLTWIGAMVGFFVAYAYWIALMAGLVVTALSAGFIPGMIGTVIILFVGIAFVGSLLMFIRGIGGNK
jgi:hypothetical protein